MTAIITLTRPAQLQGAPYEYWMIGDCPDDGKALDEFRAMLTRRKLDPAFDTTGYRYGKSVYFVMAYGRQE